MYCQPYPCSWYYEPRPSRRPADKTADEKKSKDAGPRLILFVIECD